MTILLSSTTATSSTATEGDVKTYLANLREFLADLLGTDSANKAAVQGLLGSILNGKITKTGAYTVTSDDRGKVIDCTGTWTLSVAAAATLGDGFCFAVRNSGLGTITLDPNLSETINGQTIMPIGANAVTIIYCDGVSFSTVGVMQSKGCQVVTASGNFTIPAGVTSIKATIVGGGGGGGGGTSGGGGGGGGAAIAYLNNISPGKTIAVVVGAGGTGGANGLNGNQGGSSSIASGTQSIATVSASGGNPGLATASNSTGGAGGVGSGGNINLSGGGGAGFGGPGGSSVFGGGANGLGPAGVGKNGSSYGGGGGGAVGSYSGGNGASGVVIFEW